jgi:hypothetical protein
MFREIATNYKTDKFTSHTYLDTYDKILSSRKDSIKNLFEIGVWLGGSILLWHDFLPNSNIYSVDINPLPPDFILKDRMIHFTANAYDISFIDDKLKNIKFDMIIDDGPHTYDILCKVLFSKTKSRWGNDY